MGLKESRWAETRREGPPGGGGCLGTGGVSETPRKSPAWRPCRAWPGERWGKAGQGVGHGHRTCPEGRLAPVAGRGVWRAELGPRG